MAELRRVRGAVGTERDALDVAVTAGVDRRRSRIVLGDGAVHRDAQDLAVERAGGGGVLGLEGVARADPQVPVRPDGDAAAVVPVGGLDAVEQHPADGEGAVVGGDGERDDAVPVPPGDGGEDGTVGRELRGGGDAEQAALRAHVHAGDDADRSRGAAALGGDPYDLAGDALGDERRSVGEEREPPGCLQIGHQLDRLAKGRNRAGARGGCTDARAGAWGGRPGWCYLRLTRRRRASAEREGGQGRQGRHLP